MYTVPKVSDVARWDIISSGEGVLEEEAAIYHDVYIKHVSDFHKVSIPGQKAKYFKGETAWMDSQRYADDERFKIRIAKDYG